MSRHIPNELRGQVREYFLEQCAYCRAEESLTIVTFEIEHIVPLSAGRQTEFSNLCLACPACNRFKSDSVSAADSSGREVSLFHPHEDTWDDHFDWSVGGTVIVALSRVGEATLARLRMNREQVVLVREMWVELDRHPPQVSTKSRSERLDSDALSLEGKSFECAVLVRVG